MMDTLMDETWDLSPFAEKVELLFICMKNKPIMLGRSFVALLVVWKIQCGLILWHIWSGSSQCPFQTPDVSSQRAKVETVFLLFLSRFSLDGN